MNEKSKTHSNGHAKKESDVATKLQELFEEQLQDIYWAEKALVKAIPKMIKKAEDQELIAALEDHLNVTKDQVTRVEEVFAAIGKKAQAKECPAMKGLIEEAEELMEETEGIVRDAGIIGASQKVEHYEIASYGTLRAFALALGFEDAAELLGITLDEEKEADETLTGIAESSINSEAVTGSSHDDENEKASSRSRVKEYA